MSMRLIVVVQVFVSLEIESSRDSSRKIDFAFGKRMNCFIWIEYELFNHSHCECGNIAL